MILALIALFLITVTPLSAQSNFPDWRQLAPPDTVGAWIVPAKGKPAMPVGIRRYRIDWLLARSQG